MFRPTLVQLICLSFSVSIALAIVDPARNDWNAPCLEGVCSYDITLSADGIMNGTGSLIISGHTNVISDIT